MHRSFSKVSPWGTLVSPGVPVPEPDLTPSDGLELGAPCHENLCTHSLAYSHPDVSDCKDEQLAAQVLGYTQVSWDNPRKEKQPDSAKKYWTELTQQERAAAVVLGYTKTIWDKGGKKDQPDSAKKYWGELTSCGEHSCIPCHSALHSLISAR